jgi:acyl-CoA reductase-like NAD-dependent aldehyde dehydrogenase
MTTAHNGGSTEAATQDGNLLEIGARDQKLDAVSHGGLNIPGEVFDEARQQAKDEAKKAKDDARFAKATARFAKRRAEIIAALASKTDKPEHREAAAAAAKKGVHGKFTPEEMGEPAGHAPALQPLPA